MQFSCIRSRIGLDKRARNIVVIDHVTFNTFPISHNCFSIEAQQKNFDSVEENHVDIMEELSKRGMPHAEHELEIIEMNYKIFFISSFVLSFLISAVAAVRSFLFSRRRRRSFLPLQSSPPPVIPSFPPW
ncbi:unnamed protein product [Vicia faba]|uniref:Transmembrane protein n=1 Tax=Vicia faba TaxID=3906 RepID=A0AAV1B3D2_VICFA|nr:unnamed protein product [Vicia faba]